MERWLEGRVLNACAGKVHLEHDGMHDMKRGPARRKLMKLVKPGGVLIECG